MKRSPHSPKRKSSRTLARVVSASQRRQELLSQGGFYERRKCSDKVLYAKNQARTTAARLTKKFGVKMDAYECEVCGEWHVGKDGWV
jgi:hypothetical protein